MTRREALEDKYKSITNDVDRSIGIHANKARHDPAAVPADRKEHYEFMPAAERYLAARKKRGL